MSLQSIQSQTLSLSVHQAIKLARRLGYYVKVRKPKGEGKRHELDADIRLNEPKVFS